METESNNKSSEGPKSEKIYNILIVDDENDVSSALMMTLKRAKQFNSKILTASDGEKALAELEKDVFDLVISDFRMPGMDGVEFLNKVKEKYPRITRILITGYSEVDVAKKAINFAKVDSYLEKPWDREELISIISDALNQQEQETPIKQITKDTNNVQKALKQIKDTQEQGFNSFSTPGSKKRIIIEFKSSEELNEFSMEIEQMKNADVENIQTFENKYIVTLGIYLGSVEKIM